MSRPQISVLGILFPLQSSLIPVSLKLSSWSPPPKLPSCIPLNLLPPSALMPPVSPPSSSLHPRPKIQVFFPQNRELSCARLRAPSILFRSDCTKNVLLFQNTSEPIWPKRENVTLSRSRLGLPPSLSINTPVFVFLVTQLRYFLQVRHGINHFSRWLMWKVPLSLLLCGRFVRCDD